MKWTDIIPTKEGWYLIRSVSKNCQQHFGGMEVWHCHPATQEKGYDNMPLEIGKPCFGSQETRDDFPRDFFKYCVFTPITLPKEEANA